jgi:hypothetical protein
MANLGHLLKNPDLIRLIARGVSYYGCAIYIKSILRQKTNYKNSSISPRKKYNLKKNPLKEARILQDIIIL